MYVRIRKADTEEPGSAEINLLDEIIQKYRKSLEKCSFDSGIGGAIKARFEGLTYRI